MLPCIYEGVPSQDSETLQQSAVDTLISRCRQRGIPFSDNGAASPRLTDAKWPQTGLLACGPFPTDFLQLKSDLKGNSCLGEGSVKGNSSFQFRDMSTGSGSVSASSASDRTCFCSDLQRYIQSHVFFPSLPSSGNTHAALASHTLPLYVPVL